MKFISKILAKFGGSKEKPSSDGKKFNIFPLLWGLGIIFLAVLSIWMLVSRFVLNKDVNINTALASGQRLEVSLETGEINGRITKLGDSAKDEEKPESKTEAKKGNTDKEIPLTEQKTEERKDNPLAWMEQDFVGPRLPEEVINALLSEDLSKSKLAADTISIKDISAKPVVVIIIKGMGLSASSTREALGLPKEITMGFSPYSTALEGWVKKVKEKGHDVLLNIPMETSDYQTDNPGPYSLLTQASDGDNATRLKMLLGLLKDCQAVYSDDNEVFTRSANSIKPILEALKKENKYLVYGGGYANYSLIQTANSINYPILVNDLILDDDISATAINEKFKEMEKIANDKGYVVVMAHPYPITIRMLEGWLQTVPEKNLVVSPVSVLLGKVFK